MSRYRFGIGDNVDASNLKDEGDEKPPEVTGIVVGFLVRFPDHPTTWIFTADELTLADDQQLEVEDVLDNPLEDTLDEQIRKETRRAIIEDDAFGKTIGDLEERIEKTNRDIDELEEEVDNVRDDTWWLKGQPPPWDTGEDPNGRED